MRKKQLIKSMAIAMAGVLFASCAISASASSPVTITGTGTTTINGANYNSTPDGGGLSGGPAEIDVQARATGGSEIVYDIVVSWGAMQFEYDYGSTWDPVNHQYTAGNSGNQTGGWTVGGVNGENNKITVKNNSNFPMTASFSFEVGETLNAAQAPGSVVGIFSTANTDFKATPSSTTTTNLLNLGLMGTGIQQMQTAKLDLEMDASQLATGIYYYATDGTVRSDAAASEKNMYFALSGKPDNGVASTLASVGKISVALSPFANASRRVTPISG